MCAADYCRALQSGGPISSIFQRTPHSGVKCPYASVSDAELPTQCNCFAYIDSPFEVIAFFTVIKFPTSEHHYFYAGWDESLQANTGMALGKFSYSITPDLSKELLRKVGEDVTLAVISHWNIPTASCDVLETHQLVESHCL